MLKLKKNWVISEIGIIDKFTNEIKHLHIVQEPKYLIGSFCFFVFGLMEGAVPKT